MYFVVDPSGQKFGPADVATLNQWITEGRVTAQSILEDASTGQRISASTLPGLNFPGAAAGPGAANPYGNTFQQPPGMAFGGDDGQGDITKSYIGSALFCCCCLGPIMGIVFADKAKKKGNPNAQTALIIAVVALCLSVGLGIVGQLTGGMSRFGR